MQLELMIEPLTNVSPFWPLSHVSHVSPDALDGKLVHNVSIVQ